MLSLESLCFLQRRKIEWCGTEVLYSYIDIICICTLLDKKKLRLYTHQRKMLGILLLEGGTIIFSKTV